MKAYTYSAGNFLSLLCKSEKKFGMFINVGDLLEGNADPWQTTIPEMLKAAPYLKELVKPGSSAVFELFLSGQLYLLFDTREEMETNYNQTVGDDGPTKLNDYNGPFKVYALTCDDAGQMETENT